MLKPRRAGLVMCIFLLAPYLPQHLHFIGVICFLTSVYTPLLETILPLSPLCQVFHSCVAVFLIIPGAPVNSRHTRNARNRLMNMLNARFQGKFSVITCHPLPHTQRRSLDVSMPGFQLSAWRHFPLNFDEHVHRGDPGITDVAWIPLKLGIISFF